MKHIDKPAASDAETTGTAQMPGAIADNWADAWTRQLGRSGNIYGRVLAGMRDGFTAFAQKRLEANMETAQAWYACRDANEALALQQSWFSRAIAHYGEEASRIQELCRGAVFSTEPEPAQRTPAEPKAAVERKPAQEAHPPIRHAAE